MRQNRLLLLLALLMTVATGTWAQEPTKVTMAANDKTMGTVEVGGESKVEWTADTWQGWTTNTKEYTVGDITMTSTQGAYIQEYTANCLDFFVSENPSDNASVTFSTTGDPFTRIEFAMMNDYDPGSGVYHGIPNIQPADGWTFSGKSAVWEGEATKSLTLQSCSTQVSKITFFKGAVPDGVIVNGDGIFTVAKTATVKLTATPKEGYKFLYWEDDHSNTNPVREVTIEPGEADMTYTAVFAEITYNVTFADGIEDADKWSATPNTEVKKDTKVDIKYTGAKKVLGVKAAKKTGSAVLAPALENGATVVIICNWGYATTTFTYTNNGGTFSGQASGYEAVYFHNGLELNGKNLSFGASNVDNSEYLSVGITFNTESSAYSYTGKGEDFVSFTISVNGTDVTDQLSELK